VSNALELEKTLQELAVRNACVASGTARLRRWHLCVISGRLRKESRENWVLMN
jgi:hypothetical protein